MTKLERLLAGEKATFGGYLVLKVIDHRPECKDGCCISVFYKDKGNMPWQHDWLSEADIEHDIVFDHSVCKRLLSGQERATIFGDEIYSVTSYAKVMDGAHNILILYFIDADTGSKILNSAWLSKSAIEERYKKGDIVFLKDKKR